MSDTPTPRDVLAQLWIKDGVSRESSYEAADGEIAALTAAGYTVEPGWRDIATAPRDGERVDLWVGRFANGEYRDEPYRAADAKWDEHEERWRTYDGPYEPIEITHWRPLPAAPTAEGEAR